MSVGFTPPVGPDGEPIQDDEFVAKQQAQYEAEQAAERQRVADLEAANPTVATVDKYREAGGYLLMDPQWTLGLNPDMSDPNTPEGRTEYVTAKVLAGEMAAWQDDAGVLNPLPLSPAGIAHLQGYGSNGPPEGGQNGRWNEGLRMGYDAALYGQGSHTAIAGWPAPSSTGQ